ncbi:hypothetical protein PsYK624_150100 [Phanerochaete sordida]|uniref:Uncharacterized protein n=1 Tax=Phanerochaete sordida TaxID=48140 RepID=A0A9P3GR14_9APHY|nr:hypothetical protein PsYK624_150100 [Phanerochaete sordida]
MGRSAHLKSPRAVREGSYNLAKKGLVSYNVPHIASIEAQYIDANNLAGNRFWDKTNTPDSLVLTTADVPGALDQTQNRLNYPDSKCDKIRGKIGSGTSTWSSAATAPAGSSPSGQCANVAAWSSGSVYTGRMTAVYGRDRYAPAHIYRTDRPDQFPSAAGVWTDNAAC